MILALAYQDVPVRLEPDKSEGCLTDMYRAYRASHLKAGGTEKEIEHKRPAQWLRLSYVQQFREYVRTTFNGGVDPIWTHIGNGGGTWGHWQMVMAYGQYLSEAVHAWVNSAARSVMEGLAVTGCRADAPLAETQVEQIAAVVQHEVQPVKREMAEVRREVAAWNDPRYKLTRERVSSLEILIDEGAVQKDRRRIQNILNHRLMKWCFAVGDDPRKHKNEKHPQNVLTFPIAVVEPFLKAEGRALIADHNAMAGAQYRLALKPPKKLKKPKGMN